MTRPDELPCASGQFIKGAEREQSTQHRKAQVLDMEACTDSKEEMNQGLSVIDEKEEASADSYYLQIGDGLMPVA